MSLRPVAHALAGAALGTLLGAGCTGANPDQLEAAGAGKNQDADVATGDARTNAGGEVASGGHGGAPRGGADAGGGRGEPSDARPGDVHPDARGPGFDASPICDVNASEGRDCGLNGRGRESRTCIGETWSPYGPCVDPDLCVDDTMEPQACGLQGRGTSQRICAHGQWSDFGPCEDPDRTCVDGTSESQPCGLNGRGEQVHACIEGHYGPFAPCADPDECIDDATDERICGLNERGHTVRTCRRGAWGEFSDCRDPDRCLDGATESRPCEGGDVQTRTCVGGRPGEWSPCEAAPSPCEAPLEAVVGETPARLGETNLFVSTCNAAAGGELVFRFRAPASGVYDFRGASHRNDFSVALRNVCAPDAPEISCVVNSSRTMAMVAGQEVFILVEGTANRRDFTLEVRADVAADSACSAPQAVGLGSTDGHTGGDSTMTARCAEATGPEQIYVFVARAAGLYTFDTAGTDFDTVLSLRRSCLDIDAERTCNDDVGGSNDTSLVSAELGLGELVYVIVDGWQADEAGDFTLRVSGPDRLNDPAPMVRVPAGPFLRGAAADNLPAAERPLRPVTLRGFELDRHEVTVGQYRACVDAGRCPDPSTSDGCNWTLEAGDAQPMNCLSWYEAANYCTQFGKRLPSEAEWEKSARGGCETHGAMTCDAADDALSYPWGSAPAPDCTHAWLLACAAGETAPVPATDPDGNSVYGIQDLAGNVSEPTLDCYDERFYADGPDVDPLLDSPNCDARTARGGSALDDSWRDVRAARRISVNPVERQHGVRCAR